jgi:hypothetical protein
MRCGFLELAPVRREELMGGEGTISLSSHQVLELAPIRRKKERGRCGGSRRCRGAAAERKMRRRERDECGVKNEK